MTVNQGLVRLCRLWKKRLWMKDWTIDVQIAPPTNELLVNVKDEESAWGGAFWYPEAQTAEIRISTKCPLEDREETLIHELLHVLVSGHKPPRAANVHEERAINSLAQALVTGYKRRKRKNA